MTLKQLASFSLGPVGAAVLSLASLPIMAWVFTAEDIGRFAMFQISISFSILLFTLGLDQAYVREFHETENTASLLKATFAPGFTILVVTIAAWLLLPVSLSEILFGHKSLFTTCMLFWAILLAFSSRFLGLVLRMHERAFVFSLGLIAPKLVFVLLLVIYALSNLTLGFEALIAAQTTAFSAAFLTYLLATRIEWKAALAASINKPKQQQMLGYATPLIGSGLAFWGLTAMDKAFLRGLSSFGELGVYSVAVSFAGVGLVFQSIFSTIWKPMVYKWSATKIETAKVVAVINSVAIAVIIIWCMTGVLSWIVPMALPAEYGKIENILLAAIAYPLLYTLSESTSVGIGITRRTSYSLLAALTAAGVNALANWLLIPVYGASGAAMATAMSFYIFFVIRTEASARLWQDFPRSRIYILVLVITALSIAKNILVIPPIPTIMAYALVALVSLICFKREASEAVRYFYHAWLSR